MGTPEPIGQQGQWLDLLAEYDITIQHRPGRVHSNSNASSRRPCERDGETECRQCRWPAQGQSGTSEGGAPSSGDEIGTSALVKSTTAAVKSATKPVTPVVGEPQHTTVAPVKSTTTKTAVDTASNNAMRNIATSGAEASKYTAGSARVHHLEMNSVLQSLFRK